MRLQIFGVPFLCPKFRHEAHSEKILKKPAPGEFKEPDGFSRSARRRVKRVRGPSTPPNDRLPGLGAPEIVERILGRVAEGALDAASAKNGDQSPKLGTPARQNRRLLKFTVTVICKKYVSGANARVVTRWPAKRIFVTKICAKYFSHVSLDCALAIEC
jgi:hypothetical protein